MQRSHNVNAGHDTIKDFEIGVDILDLDNFWYAEGEDGGVWDFWNIFGSNNIFATNKGDDLLITGSTDLDGWGGGSVGLHITLVGLAGTTISDLNDAGSITLL